MLITTLRVVRISFVSIFLYQVSFVRSDKGFDRVHCKTVGTSQDLERLFKRSQDFLGKPEEKVVLARKALKSRGIIMPGEESIKNPGNTPTLYISPRWRFETPANSLSSTTFLRTTPIVVELNPIELTVALFSKDLAALRRPSARCREAHLVKDDLRP